MRFAYKQQAELRKPFGRRCDSSDMQQVLGRCCQALLSAPEVQGLRLMPFIQGTEHTRLMSILPSSGSLLGLFVVFLGLTLQVSNKRCQILPAPEKSSLKQVGLHHTACPGGKSGSKARRALREVVLEIREAGRASLGQLRMIKSEMSHLGLAGDWGACRQLRGLSCLCGHNRMGH